MLTRAAREYEEYRDRGSLASRARRILRLVALTFLAYHLIAGVFLRSIEIGSVSMEPTLAVGDRVLAVPLIYGPRVRLFGFRLPGIREPRRGDIVYARPAYVEEEAFLRRAADPFVRFFTLEQRRAIREDPNAPTWVVKRVIGIPGDSIVVERFTAYIKSAESDSFVGEHELIARSYELQTDERPELWDGLDPFGASAEEVTLGAGEYFLLSDDRSSGTDSRHWGPAQIDDLEVALLLRYWPLRSFGRP